MLIVCTHLRRDRSRRRSRDFLQPMTGLHIAAQIDAQHYDITLHHEDWHGPYDTRGDDAFALVFLTGLQADFDRMRQLSFHFRRRGAIVIAGGNICSLFPEFATRFFDVVCAGGVEAIRDFMADYERGSQKPLYRSAQSRVSRYRIPYELVARAKIALTSHLIETSRGCTFRCDFCVIPAEGARYAAYDIDMVRQQIDDAIDASPSLSFRRWYPTAFFLDNNFSDDPERLRALCAMLRGHPRLRAWGALITQNVLRDRPTIKMLAEAKCGALFVGLESLDEAFLRRHNKKQNLSRHNDVFDDILHAERLGICITYAYLFDPRHSDVDDMRRQITRIVTTPAMPMPAFLSFIQPLAGTALFWDCAAAGELAPNLRLRDLDGETIAFAGLADTRDRLSDFARHVTTEPRRLIHRWTLLRSTFQRIWNARRFNPFYWYVLYSANHRVLENARAYRGEIQRRYIAGIDALDPQYGDATADISDADRQTYFEPIRVTDPDGNLMPWLLPYAPRTWTPAAPPQTIAAQ